MTILILLGLVSIAVSAMTLAHQLGKTRINLRTFGRTGLLFLVLLCYVPLLIPLMYVFKGRKVQALKHRNKGNRERARRRKQREEINK